MRTKLSKMVDILIDYKGMELDNIDELARAAAKVKPTI